MSEQSVVIVGAGPAGLSAAHLLARKGVAATVYEADLVVGGLSRTERRGDFRFDIGGHRFFTKMPDVLALWREALSGQDLIRHTRRSRILTPNGYLDYPIVFPDVLSDLGPLEAARSLISLLGCRIRPPMSDQSLEGWARRRYGNRLYEYFTAPYTRKVWGTDPARIPAIWAAQRIKSPSVRNVVHDLRRRLHGNEDQDPGFWYPRHGPGMLWESIAQQATANGARVELGSRVTEIHHARGRARAAVIDTGESHPGREVPVTDLMSSMPLAELIRALRPLPPQIVLSAAARLRHRCLVVVALVLDRPLDVTDMWIYVPDPTLHVGRVQHYPSWSPDMSPEGVSTMGLEYFMWPHDPLWRATDEEVSTVARDEFAMLPFDRIAEIRQVHVFRVASAYPVYDVDRPQNLAIIRRWLEGAMPNVHLIGRNGLHRYDNQDHAALTGLLAAENVLGASHDVWSVNAKSDYHEDGTVIAAWS